MQQFQCLLWEVLGQETRTSRRSYYRVARWRSCCQAALLVCERSVFRLRALGFFGGVPFVGAFPSADSPSGMSSFREISMSLRPCRYNARASSTFEFLAFGRSRRLLFVVSINGKEQALPVLLSFVHFTSISFWFAMFADFLKVVQQLRPRPPWMRLVAVSKYWSDSSIPMKLRPVLTAATPVPPDPMKASKTMPLRGQMARGSPAAPRASQSDGSAAWCHYRDVVDARQGLSAFSSLPVNRRIAIGAPDHEPQSFRKRPGWTSADALVPYDDAPPHPAGHLHNVRHRKGGFASPRTSPGSPLPGLLPQLAAHPSHKGRGSSAGPCYHRKFVGEPGGPVEVVVGILGRRAGLAVAGMSSAGE